jgi:septal ring factor EnvC (AmiA/AmiB activator)
VDSRRDLRDALAATKGQVKATLRTLRTTSQLLADLEERFEALEDAQPEEAQREHETSFEIRGVAV